MKDLQPWNDRKSRARVMLAIYCRVEGLGLGFRRRLLQILVAMLLIYVEN